MEGREVRETLVQWEHLDSRDQEVLQERMGFQVHPDPREMPVILGLRESKESREGRETVVLKENVDSQVNRDLLERG